MEALSFSVNDHGTTFDLCSDLFGFGQLFPDGLFPSVGWLVIMIVWVAAWILSSSIEYLSARLYNSSIIASWFKDSDRKKRSRWPKASPKVLEDYIHAIQLYLLDDLLEPPCEVLNRLFFLLENSL